MSLFLSWVLFPLVLGAIGLGWGALVERAAALRLNSALLIPLGWAAAIVLAGTLTSFSATAKAATAAVAVGAVVGLVLVRPWGRIERWWLLAAVGVLLVYGAPVLLSGQATFTGFIKLDDTATWFNVVDIVMAHGHTTSGLAPSTFTLLYNGDVGPSYPVGAFMLPGVARALVGSDIAWVFQPYLASCAAAVALCIYALTQPLLASRRLRALVAFLGAQSALLYGYSLWGGIKELTASFLLILGVALAAPLIAERPSRPRQLLALCLAAGALIVTLGPGAAGWVLPALAFIAVVWCWRGRGKPGNLRTNAISLTYLAGLTALFVIPVWVVLGTFLGGDSGLFSSGQSTATQIGNLLHPLSPFQLAGIWPDGDFRATAPTLPSALLIGLALIAAVIGLWLSARQRRYGPALYAAVALVGCGAIYLAGATPWVLGKTLAISSPALLTLALTGAALLAIRHRLGILVLAVLAGGVLWSNALAYHAVTLAPRASLSELQHIGTLVAGRGPTFINDYEVYADRHFLREGDPVEPAEYRPVDLPLRDGTLLTKSAWADIDSFPLSTLEPYRSLVLRRSPTESRPPSIYHLVYRGDYYELWQREPVPSTRIIEHVPLGESNTLPFCGSAQFGPSKPLCSVDPVAISSCTEILALGKRAGARHATLLAYQRPAPIVARADQTLWPGRWIHNVESRTLTPTVPGAAITHIRVSGGETYELWLGGTFARGFEVSVDGHYVGRVKDQLSSVDSYVHLINLSLAAGLHEFMLTYPHADLTPGSGLAEYTNLSAIVLQPQNPASELISATPEQAGGLCGRPLDWIEIVAPA